MLFLGGGEALKIWREERELSRFLEAGWLAGSVVQIFFSDLS